MIETIKKWLGIGPSVDLGQLITDGALIMDVRSPAEYAGGHIKKSVNVPLGTVEAYCKKLDKNKPVITCCASGMRSAAAKSTLKARGFLQVYNGGSWQNLRKYEK